MLIERFKDGKKSVFTHSLISGNSGSFLKRANSLKENDHTKTVYDIYSCCRHLGFI